MAGGRPTPGAMIPRRRSPASARSSGRGSRRMGPSLLALSRAEEQAAKDQFALKLRLQVAVVAIALIAQFVKAPGAYFLALAVALGEGLAWWMGHRAREQQHVA